MKGSRLVSAAVGVSCVVVFWLFTGATSLYGQDGKPKEPKELGGTDDKQTISIVLGKSPGVSFLLWSGHAVVLAQVAIEPADKPDTFKAKIVKFDRLSYDDKKKEYAHRTSPQIKKIPFECENGLTYTLRDGSKWELGDEFTISKKNLEQRVKDIPEYKADGRNWFQMLGAKNAAEGLDMTRTVIEAAKPAPKK